MREYLNAETGECYPLDTPEGLAGAVLAEQAGIARLARTLTRRLEESARDNEARAGAQDAALMGLRAQVDELVALLAPGLDATGLDATGVDATGLDPGIDPALGTVGPRSRGTGWCWRTLTGAAADQLWTRLRDWVVWLRARYPLAHAIPACWAQHPELVEELTALHLAWVAAYTDPTAAPTAPADWHTHYLPAALERIPGWGVHCTDTHRPRPPGVYADLQHHPRDEYVAHGTMHDTAQRNLLDRPPVRTVADAAAAPDPAPDPGTDHGTRATPGHRDVAAGQEAS
jgi:hypothetical protein